MPMLVFTNRSLLFFHLGSEAASAFLKTVIKAAFTSYRELTEDPTEGEIYFLSL